MATKIGLESFSPPQLTAVRFLIAAVPALVLPRPALSWSRLIAIGSTLFAGQFLLQFFAIANGLPPGLAAVLVQTQALFTIVFAAMAMRERPTTRQVSGVTVAFGGLVLIVLTIGQDLTVAGFCLAMGSAVSWAIGNVLLKREPSPPGSSLPNKAKTTVRLGFAPEPSARASCRTATVPEASSSAPL